MSVNVVALLMGSTAFVNPKWSAPQVINYYIDGVTGNDGNNGLSVTSAWKTVRPLVFTNVSGKTVGFRRGQSFDLSLITPGMNIAAGTSTSQTVYTGFGMGPKPILTGALASFAGPWTQVIGPIYNIGNVFDAEWEDGSVPPGWTTGVTGSDGVAAITLGYPTSSLGSPLGWQNGCLKCVSSSSYHSQALLDFTSAGLKEPLAVYFRCEFIVGDISSVPAGHDVTIQTCYNNFGTPLFEVHVVPATGGFTMALRTTATKPVASDAESAAVYDTFSSSTVLATGTAHLLELQWDLVDRVWAWKVDGTVLNSGAMNAANTVGPPNDCFWGADLRSAGSPATIYFDGTAISSTDWLGPIYRETGPTGLWHGPSGGAAPFLMYNPAGTVMRHAAQASNLVISTDSWFVDTAANLVWVFSPTTPGTYQGATSGTVCDARDHSYVTFDGLDVRGGNVAIQIGSGTNQLIINCTGREAAAYGLCINGGGTNPATVNPRIMNSKAHNCGSSGIAVFSSSPKYIANAEIGYNESFDTCWDYGHLNSDFTYAFNAGIKLFGNLPGSAASAWVHHNDISHTGNFTRIANVSNAQRVGSGLGAWIDTFDGPVVFEQNYIHDNQSRAFRTEMLAQGPICMARANLIVRNGTAGVAANRFTPGAIAITRGSINVVFESNTVYDNTGYALVLEGDDGIGAEGFIQSLANITIRNSILVPGPTGQGVIKMTGPISGTTMQKNCTGADGYDGFALYATEFDAFGNPILASFSTMADFEAATGLSTDSVIVAPGFAKPYLLPIPDLRLAPGSPCIGAGATPSSSFLDFNGRPYGSPPDIGAIST